MNRPVGEEEAVDMSAKDPGSLLTRDQGEDSIAESEKLSWQDQRHGSGSDRPYRVIKRPIRYLY